MGPAVGLRTGSVATAGRDDVQPTSCAGQQGKDDCPPIGNFKLKEGGQVKDAAKEVAFLSTFREAFGDEFQFEEGAVLEVQCDTLGIASARPSEYRLDGQPVKRFTLGGFTASGFRSIVRAP